MFCTSFKKMLLRKNCAKIPIATTKIKEKRFYIQETIEITLKCEEKKYQWVNYITHIDCIWYQL